MSSSPKIWSPKSRSKVCRQRCTSGVSAAAVSLISSCGMPARKPSTTSSGQCVVSSSISACAVDSPIPKVCSLRRYSSPPPSLWVTLAQTAGSIARSSLGTPGVVRTNVPAMSSANPTALPTGLSMSSAPSGSHACLRLASLGSILRSPHQRRTCCSASGCSTSGTPAAAATNSAVKSSRVGPRPPFMIRTLAR